MALIAKHAPGHHGGVISTSTMRFLGGARTVTGSKFLVTHNDSQVLVDCGLYQGPRELREANWAPPPVDPSMLDAVVLTHAHVDHCGYLPRLFRSGFRGPVYCTGATAELVRIVLPDCGHLQEEEAEFANRKGYSRHEPALPLYTEEDAWEATSLLCSLTFDEEREIAPDVTIQLSPAGHILGSGTLSVRLGAGGPVIGFSGDLGRRHHPLLVPPVSPGAVDHLVVESTYGNRRHDDAAALDTLAEVIQRTIGRGGHVLIPAFAVDRTEVLLHHLAGLARCGRLPDGVPIFVDSPMALKALDVYRDAVARRDADVRPELSAGPDPFGVPNLVEARSLEESKALNAPARPSIVISAAGMASGGRVVHHLAHMLPERRNTVVFVGYQAEGTRGRQLVEGATELKMLGRYVRVRAEIVDLPAFSVHADSAELLEWVASADTAPQSVYVVHGEPEPAMALAHAIEHSLDWTAAVPQLGEIVRLDR